MKESGFKDIQALIQRAKKDTSDTVPYTYICVGDSTRARSTFPSGVEGEYLFYELRNNLSSYGVKSKLLARHGHRLEQLLDESKYPRISQVIAAIPKDGTNTIIDISLGINDLLTGRDKSEIKADLQNTINKIKKAKPHTTFMLTTPTRILGDISGTTILRDIYHEVSSQNHIPLNTVIDSLMPTAKASKKSWYRDQDNLHLSRSGQHHIAQFILRNILSDKKPFPTHHDSALIYQNNQLNIDITKERQNVTITRLSDKKEIWNSTGKVFFKDHSKGNIHISYKLYKRDGGVDIKYIISNPTDTAQSMPSLQVPGIKLTRADNLNILNNYRLYIEKRRWDKNLKKKKNYYIVGSHIGHYTNKKKQEVRYDADVSYGGKTNGLYAPVILADDGDFAVGTSLNYPFLDYVSGVSDKKLHPFTRIYKDADSWRYLYWFDNTISTLPAYRTYHITIPVRFSQADKALLTLYPYKDHFNYLYRVNNPPADKDTSPSLFSIWSFVGNDTQAINPRGWNWAFIRKEDKVATLPLLEVGRGLKSMMQKKGYKRILFNSFSGVYRVDNNHPMNSELPFEFITKHPNQKQLDKFLTIFHQGKHKQRYTFWWGIAGMIPMKGNHILENNDWSPSTDIHFDYANRAHRNYARKHLQSAIDKEADGLSLDAFVRMEAKSAIRWMDEMKRKLSTNTKLLAELNQDIYHTRGGIFLQPTNPGLVKEQNKITQPPILAQYLNPNAEIQIFMQNRFFDNTTKETHYMRELVKMGYTPQITINNNGLANSGHSEDIEKRIKEGSKFFIDVKGLDNSIIYTCFDGIDNDGDGKVDWPYDEGCSTAMASE